MAVRRPAFTLIELLVVVSIIALLLLLISPTIQLVTEHRAKVTCLRNLQSQHVAAMQYSNDFNGLLVPIHPKTTNPRTCYSDELQKYLEYNDAVFRCPNVNDLSLDLDSANNKILCYGINHYGRADRKSGVSPNYHRSLGHKTDSVDGTGLEWISIRLVANTDVIYLSDADYDESPENVGGVSRGSWEWPLRYSFQEDAWNRHMGRRDPVLPRPGTGKHDRTQYMTAFENGDPEMENIWGGYNGISLSGSGVWRRGYPATNRAWFVKKHTSN
jgi:prepilin-type N-terminal cleavage/methylation domain-containing protein